jgi:hypothetical protein
MSDDFLKSVSLNENFGTKSYEFTTPNEIIMVISIQCVSIYVAGSMCNSIFMTIR